MGGGGRGRLVLAVGGSGKWKEKDCRQDMNEWGSKGKRRINGEGSGEKLNQKK